MTQSGSSKSKSQKTELHQSASKKEGPVHPLLHDPGWLDVMRQHFDLDASEFALRFPGRTDWPVREIAEQLHCYPRAKAKLGPLHRPGMIYLREALEQASGYAAATWRARNWITTRGEKGHGTVSGDDASPLVKSDANSGIRPHDIPDSPYDSQSEPDSIFRVADLTGGLGIDAAAFSLAGAWVDYCERNPVLASVARHNHGLLELAPRIRWHTGDGMEWLASRQREESQQQGSQRVESQQQGSQRVESQPADIQSEDRKLDLLYIDPSRRPGGKRVLSLQDSVPDVTRHLGLIRSATRRCLIKLSPMMDPVDAARSLEDCVAVIAVSVDGELKELLADCIPSQGQKQGQGQKRGQGSPGQRCPPVHCAVMLDASGEERFRFSNASGASGTTDESGVENSFAEQSSHAQPGPVRSGPPGTLLFEPDPSLFKMRLIDEAARRYGLIRIHPGIGYLTNGQLPSPSGQPTSTGPPSPSTPGAFPGKVFRIRRTLPYKPRHLKKWLEETGLTRVHIHQRGFPLTVDQLYKKLGCRMGEDAHLFATMSCDGQKVVIVADRVG